MSSGFIPVSSTVDNWELADVAVMGRLTYVMLQYEKRIQQRKGRFV